MTLKPNLFLTTLVFRRTLRLQRSLSLVFLLHKESPRTACMGNRRRYWSLIKVENAIDVSFVVLFSFNQFQRPRKRKRTFRLYRIKTHQTIDNNGVEILCSLQIFMWRARLASPAKIIASWTSQKVQLDIVLWILALLLYWGNLLYLAMAILRSLNPEWHGFSFFNALHAFTSRSITVVNSSNRQGCFDETRRYSVL